MLTTKKNRPKQTNPTSKVRCFQKIHYAAFAIVFVNV